MMQREDVYFPYFGILSYVDPEVYYADEGSEYFTAYGEWDIVRFSDGHFAYTKLGDSTD